MDKQGQQILQHLRAGDEQGINMLFSSYFAPLCLTAHRIVNNSDTAKDIVQDVFVRIWSQREKLHINTTLQAYLKRSVVNASIDHKRKGYELRKVRLEDAAISSRETPGPQSDSADKLVEGKDAAEQVDRAIAELPDRCRLVFTLSRHEGMTYSQIAKKLEISPKTVENQMTKALKSLRLSLSALLTLCIFLCRYLFFFNQA